MPRDSWASDLSAALAAGPLLGEPEVMAYLGIEVERTFRRLVRDGKFPRPVRVAPGVRRWHPKDVAWYVLGLEVGPRAFRDPTHLRRDQMARLLGIGADDLDALVAAGRFPRGLEYGGPDDPRWPPEDADFFLALVRVEARLRPAGHPPGPPPPPPPGGG